MANIAQAAADGTLTSLQRIVPAAGSVTIYGNANATAACRGRLVDRRRPGPDRRQLTHSRVSGNPPPGPAHHHDAPGIFGATHMQTLQFPMTLTHRSNPHAQVVVANAEQLAEMPAEYLPATIGGAPAVVTAAAAIPGVNLDAGTSTAVDTAEEAERRQSLDEAVDEFTAHVQAETARSTPRAPSSSRTAPRWASRPPP
jgi:hypothetical protein